MTTTICHYENCVKFCSFFLIHTRERERYHKICMSEVMFKKNYFFVNVFSSFTPDDSIGNGKFSTIVAYDDDDDHIIRKHINICF